MPISRNLRQRARSSRGDIAAATAIALEIGRDLATASHTEIVDSLSALGSGDLSVARVVEPHLDAVLIQGAAGIESTANGLWGVFAAEAPDHALRATQSGGRWLLTGSKPWCSLAGRLDRALVTADAGSDRQLFAVDLHDAGIRVHPALGWVSRGLPEITSVPVDFDNVIGLPIGAPGWYLSRPGFAWGAVRVAAAWTGATAALVDYLRGHLAERSAPDPLRLYNLGAADAALWTAQLAMRHAAAAIDADPLMRLDAAELLAARTRAVVAGAAEQVLRQVGHALGPAPLAFDDEHAARVADLTVYLRQHHAERDLSALGSYLVDR